MFCVFDLVRALSCLGIGRHEAELLQDAAGEYKILYTMVSNSTAESVMSPVTDCCNHRYYDVRRNNFLLWVMLFGLITIFPTLYIPVINRVVFKHEMITWEW